MKYKLYEKGSVNGDIFNEFMKYNNLFLIYNYCLRF